MVELVRECTGREYLRVVVGGKRLLWGDLKPLAEELADELYDLGCGHLLKVGLTLQVELVLCVHELLKLLEVVLVHLR